jgi:hypothetical protein
MCNPISAALAVAAAAGMQMHGQNQAKKAQGKAADDRGALHQNAMALDTTLAHGSLGAVHVVDQIGLDDPTPSVGWDGFQPAEGGDAGIVEPKINAA